MSLTSSARIPYRSFIGIVALVLNAVCMTASSATLPAGFSETRVATGLASPTAMAFAPDGRLFVSEQGGHLRIIKNDSLLAQPFLTVSVDSSGERGLLGIAFDPQFISNGFVYVYYTTSAAPVHNRVSRFVASSTSPDIVMSGSEVVILELPVLGPATNHNGGALHFGPDGKLYIAVGENATPSAAPSLSITLGKILRINSDGTIPTDNPFINQTTGINQAIWAIGLRNPFTFAFNPANGRLHINDVGQNAWEEVNLGVAGANYGWPATEGNEPPGVAGVRYPLYTYGHTTGCAIVGAAFYNPQTVDFPSGYVGRYFFGDYCSGFIRTLSPPNYDQPANFATGIGSLVDIAVSQNGALYYAARVNGEVFRVQSTTTTSPVITQQPANATASVGKSASFTVAASGTPPLTYQWQRSGVDIAGATAATYTIPSVALADNGATFRAVVTNGVGSATSNTATLTVTANAPPTATIATPVSGTLYSGGETFAFSGSGSDAEDGPLPANALTWSIDLHHDTHVHPFMPPTTGIATGSFTIPTRDETSANVFYRLILTVRDSGNLTQTTFVDLRPRTSTLTLTSNPSGLQLTLDGQPITTPFTVVGVEGVIRTLGAVSPQSTGGTTYQFASWSDGGSATHEIATPTNDTTYTAAYQAITSSIVFTDDFETNKGWSLTPGINNARTGPWQRGAPQPTSSGGINLQLGTCGGSTNCLITGLSAGNNPGVNDVDRGLTSIQSPIITLPVGASTLTFSYYFAHLNNSSSADFFRVRVVGADGVATTVFQEAGSASNDAAAWTVRSVALGNYAGQAVRLRFEAADLSNSSLIEAGVDNVSITKQ